MPVNDPRWGRGSNDEGRQGEQDNPERRDPPQNEPRDERPDPFDRQPPRRGQSRGQGADLDQLWNDFNRTISTIFGGRMNRPGSRSPEPPRQDPPRGEPPRNEPPSGRRVPQFPQGALNSGKGLAVVIAVAVVAWAASGFYIVPEGSVGVVTTFGHYTKDTPAGFNWAIPYPVQQVELVNLASVRTAQIGTGSQRLREALMLTDDENIVDVQFTVQYRIKPNGAQDYLFRTRDPDESVTQAAESAMREVVGRRIMDSVLFESKQEIAANVKTAMQTMLDRYRTGIEVMSIAIQNAQPPQEVQAAFNDAVKAGQDRERQINEGEAYANAVIPKAKGSASRIIQEAEGYKARVVQTAAGDAQRFNQVLAQYNAAPQVTRERMYVDAMRDLYAKMPKVFTESSAGGKSGNNLYYLPLDRMMQQKKAPAAAADDGSVNTDTSAAPTSAASSNAATTATYSSSSAAGRDVDPRAMLRARGR